MTSHEIIEKLDVLINAFYGNETAINFIEELAKLYRTTGVHFDHLANEDDRNRDTALNLEFRLPIQFLESLRIGNIFLSLIHLKVELDKIDYILPRITDSSDEDNLVSSIDLLKDSVDSFYLKFEDSAGKFNYSNTFQLLKLAYSISEQFHIIKNLALSFKQMLLSQPEITEKQRELSLYFTAPIKFNELIQKLISLEELYKELCRLLEVSTSEFPLQISKLEVGSWWIKIFGESKVIALITSFAEKSVSYLHRNFTQEGKIHSIPKKVEAVDSVIALRKSLKKYGINTETLDKNIEHSAVVISNQLNELLLGEPNVEVNENKFYIGAELDEKLLNEKATLQLGNGAADSSDIESKESD